MVHNNRNEESFLVSSLSNVVNGCQRVDMYHLGSQISPNHNQV